MYLQISYCEEEKTGIFVVYLTINSTTINKIKCSPFNTIGINEKT